MGVFGESLVLGSRRTVGKLVRRGERLPTEEPLYNIKGSQEVGPPLTTSAAPHEFLSLLEFYSRLGPSRTLQPPAFSRSCLFLLLPDLYNSVPLLKLSNLLPLLELYNCGLLSVREFITQRYRPKVINNRRLSCRIRISKRSFRARL